jgi:hypothetical protein
MINDGLTPAPPRKDNEMKQTRQGDRFIKGVWMDGFSIENKTYGGRYSQKEIKDELKKRGIKYNTSQAYTIYTGHWGIYIETQYSEMVSDWLFGSLWDLPETPMNNDEYKKQKVQS